MPAAPRIFFLSLKGLLLLPACSYDPSLDIHGGRPWEEVEKQHSTFNDADQLRRLEERKEFRRQQSND